MINKFINSIKKLIVDQKIPAKEIVLLSPFKAKNLSNIKGFEFVEVNSDFFYERKYKENKDDVILIDASNLGKKVKDGKNQKTLLSKIDEQKIIDTFCSKEALDDFSVVVSYNDIAAKNYSLSAGQYFEIKIEYVDISREEFDNKLNDFKNIINDLNGNNKRLDIEIQNQLDDLAYE